MQIAFCAREVFNEWSLKKKKKRKIEKDKQTGRGGGGERRRVGRQESKTGGEREKFKYIKFSEGKRGLKRSRGKRKRRREWKREGGRKEEAFIKLQLFFIFRQLPKCCLTWFLLLFLPQSFYLPSFFLKSCAIYIIFSKKLIVNIFKAARRSWALNFKFNFFLTRNKLFLFFYKKRKKNWKENEPS